MHDATGFKSTLVEPSTYDRPRTALNTLRELRRRINRHAVLQRKTRLFCPACSALRQVRDVFATHVALLDCGHRRTVCDLGSETLLAQELFHLERDAEREVRQGQGEVA